MKRTTGLLFFILGFLLKADAVPPVLNYAGQVAVDGELYEGIGLFKFVLIKGDSNTTLWSNDGSSSKGSEPVKPVRVNVNGGLYSVLLGNSAIKGMGALDPSIFNKHGSVKLRVWFSDGENGFEHLKPDRPFAAVPYAFSAGTAETAGSTTIAPGSIDRKMLSRDIRSDLNSSLKKITRDMLPHSVLQDLNSSIKSIKRDMLPSSVLAQLDRKLTRADLPNDVLSDINSSIKLHRLSPEVLSALQISPSISTQPFARYDRSTGTAQVEVAGRGHNLSYQWFRDGSPIAGATAPVLEIADANLSDGAKYSLRLTNAIGQVTSQSVTLDQAIGAPGLPLEEANATEVPRNGLILWMDANDLNADGKADHLPADTLVTYWLSKVGDVNTTQATFLKQPKTQNWPYSELTCVSFDGSDRLLDNSTNLSTQQIFIVYRSRNYAGNRTQFINGQSGMEIYLTHADDFGGSFLSGVGGITRLNSRSTYEEIKGEPYIAIFKVGNDAFDQGRFTKISLTNGSWDGQFAEILFYDRVLPNTKRDSVERFLADKWGVTLYSDALPSAEPENGLLAYYKFEPVSIEPDKLWDYSGNNHHGNLLGFNDGNPWVDGVDGKSIQFDGVNDSVNLPTISGEHKSYAFWIRGDFPILPTEQSITIWKQDSNSRRRFLVNGGRHFGITINSGNPTRGTISNASLGKITGWTHLTLTYENEFQFYINGQSVNADSSCPFVTNGNPQLGVGTYQGRLDEFRIYNRTLTPLEIQLLYAETNGEPILRTDIEHNASVGTAYSLSLNADNSPTTYFAEGLPPGLSLNVTTGAISGTPQSAGVYPVTIRASNEHGTSEDIIQLSVYPPSYEPPQGFSSIGEDDVPTNKLALWLDANDVDADGQPDSNIGGSELLKWQDKSPRKLSAERGLPLYLSKSLNNMPSVAFNEMQRMDLGSNHIFSYGTAEENGLTIVAVANSTDPTSNTLQRKLIDFGHGPKKGWGVIFRKNGGNFYTPTDHNGIDLEYSINKTPEDFTIGSFRVSFGQLQEVFIDGNLVAFDTIGLTSLTNLEINASQYRSSTSGPLRIGGTSRDNNKHLQVKSESLTGNIAELLVWKRALTDSERVVVEQYLAQKWGLQHQTYLPPLEQPEAGLLGRWTFDEGEGNLVHDISGNRKHGAMTNMHPSNSWVDGAYGKALEFDGVDDNFTIPNLGDEYRTIAFWLKTGPITGASTIAKFGDQSVMLNVTSRPLVLCKGNTRGTNTPTSLDVTGVGWSHIAFRWNLGSTRYDILVNGQSQNVGTMWGPHASMITNESIILASSPTIKIDDLRIYSRSLTDTEIKNICGDQDEDGLTDIREAELGTDPNVADTDGDGDSDSAEISAGTSPTDPAENTMSKSLKSGLQVHLKFDETNGTTAYDSSGNNKHSTLYGFEANQTTFVDGKIGNAIKLDGANDYVMLPNALGINFTFSFWIKTSSNLGDSNSSNWDGQVGLITSSLNQHAMMLSQGKFRIWSGTSSACRMTSKNFVNNSSWIHLAASRTQAFSGGSQIGNFKMYLNGSLDSSSQKNNTRFSGGAILHIGKTHNGSNYFEGLMDNIHIYDRMLSDSEVQALYLLGL